MELFECTICNFSTQVKCNYQRHLKTKKHLKKCSESPKNVEKMWKNVEKCGKKEKKDTEKNPKNFSFFESKSEQICQFCSKNFSRSDSLQRHISVCKLNNLKNGTLKDPQGSKNVEKKINFECIYCHNSYQTKRGLNKHVRTCLLRQQTCQQKDTQILLLQKDLEKEQALNQQKDKTIEIAKNSKKIINNITTTNKTINYLNNQYGEMIAMEQFLYNLQHTEQLTQEEREKLLVSYKDSGIELFARSFSHIMKENCRRQLLKEGLPDMNLIPLYCSDGNFRSHKEKGEQGWNTHYDNHSINKMINISSQQVYQSYQKPLMIFGKERDKVFKQIKQDNHSKKLKKIHKIEDS